MKKLGESYDSKSSVLHEQYTDIANAMRDIRDFVIDWDKSDQGELITITMFMKQLRRDAKFLMRLVEERNFGL